MSKSITNKLTELVGEKFLAEEILNIKYAMEHKERKNKICDTFKNMTCVVLNTVSEEENKENAPMQTHLIFHEKLGNTDELSLLTDEVIEYYVFAFQTDELHQFRYINDIIKKKGDIFLNSEEYIGIYDISLMEESNL